MLGKTIGDETDMCSSRSRFLQVVDDFSHDGLTQTAPLVFRFDRDIYYLIKQSIISDHTAHTYHIKFIQD
jgi:hypothetical protein